MITHWWITSVVHITDILERILRAWNPHMVASWHLPYSPHPRHPRCTSTQRTLITTAPHSRNHTPHTPHTTLTPHTFEAAHIEAGRILAEPHQIEADHETARALAGHTECHTPSIPSAEGDQEPSAEGGQAPYSWASLRDTAASWSGNMLGLGGSVLDALCSSLTEEVRAEG